MLPSRYFFTSLNRFCSLLKFLCQQGIRLLVKNVLMFNNIWYGRKMLRKTRKQNVGSLFFYLLLLRDFKMKHDKIIYTFSYTFFLIKKYLIFSYFITKFVIYPAAFMYFAYNANFHKYKYPFFLYMTCNNNCCILRDY